MISLLLPWLAAAVAVSAEIIRQPSPPELAVAEPSKAAMEAAIATGLLGSGYFQVVTDKTEQASARRRFQKRLRSVGLPVSVQTCQWIGLVAQGTANGNRSYGGACRVKVGPRPAQDFLICEADLGGVTLIHPAWFASDALFIEAFIRRTCP